MQELTCFSPRTPLFFFLLRTKVLSQQSTCDIQLYFDVSHQILWGTISNFVADDYGLDCALFTKV